MPPRVSQFTRTAIVSVVVLALASAVVIWRRGTPRRGGAGAFVLVSIDTLRADRLPTYGYAKGRTPALDAFVKDAVVFEKAYAHAPQTLPSHASMFTGRLPFEHKVRDNLGFSLPPSSHTMAAAFKLAGYRTAGFVSAYVLRTETGLSQGFDVYNAEYPPASADRSPAHVQRPGLSTLAAADAWMDGQADDRLFLFLHIYEPHKPYAPPERYASFDPYDGEVSFADEITGKLIESLKRRGWYDAATVVVTADHGEGLGDHGEQEHGLFLYDETIRVPLMMKLPGREGAGKRIAPPVQHIDLLPTIGDLAGLQLAEGLRGRSLAPPLKGEGAIAPQGIYAEALYPRYHFGWSELLSLTDERYRYIKAPREELYDLDRDPKEHINIIGDRPQAAAGLRSGLEALVAGRGIDAPSAVTAEDRERLAALGYIGTPTAAQTAGATGLPDPKDKAAVLRKYREAVELIGARKQQEGAALLREIVESEPGMTDVWSQYAAVLVRMGRYGEALAAYQQVIRLNPEEANGPLGAASVLLALGRLDEARKHAELALSSAPAAAHQALADVAVAQKDYPAALREAELAQKSDPSLPLPLFVRGLIAYNQGRFAEALPYLQQARDGYAKRALQPADLHFLIGDVLARMEKYKEAEQFMLEEVRLYPASTRARAGLALLYQSTGRPDEAERALEAMLRLSPSQAAYDTAARVWRMFGRPDRAAAVEAASKAKFRSQR